MEWVKYIGLARKAGAVLFGIDNIISSRKPVHLILLSESEASENLVKKVNGFLANKNIKLISLKYTLDSILGTQNCKVIGLTNLELSKKVYSLINKE